MSLPAPRHLTFPLQGISVGIWPRGAKVAQVTRSAAEQPLDHPLRGVGVGRYRVLKLLKVLEAPLLSKALERGNAPLRMCNIGHNRSVIISI